LHGEEIPCRGRIVAVVDTFDSEVVTAFLS
jgi:response regulator RpfG family c-di-GMP phosphodiesterase